MTSRRRYITFASVGLLIVAFAVANGPARAAGTSQVNIDNNAQFDFFGTNVSLLLRVSCVGGDGTVFVTVEQQPPESATPTHGEGAAAVVCDGQQHTVGVTALATDGFFDAGNAFATAMLVAADQASDSRIITIKPV